jgi:FxsC-like protein
MNDYWFFLSYAKRDSKGNPWLKMFYEGLALEIAKIVGLSSSVGESEIGFFDEEGIEVGDEWPQAIAEALQSSKVLICLYSASYFNSEYCGKEFQIFRSRIAAYVALSQEDVSRPRLIIPVLWERPTRLPELLPQAVDNIQYTHADFGHLYSEQGLSFLMKMHKEEAYQEFLMNFAERIVKEARLHQLPQLEDLPPLKTVVSAFSQSHPLLKASHQPSTQIAMRPEPAGPETAWFVFVAGRNTDLQHIKRVVDCYGHQGGRNWQPYFPVSNKKVGLIAQGVATAKNLFNETLSISEQLVQNLRQAEETNTIVVIIVDPWSIQVEAYRKPMAEYDMARLINSGIIIIWNENDDETLQKSEMLRSEIQRTFSRSMCSADIYFRDSVASEEELQIVLSDTIEELRRKILKRAKLLRPIQSTNKSLPRINVPTEESA